MACRFPGAPDLETFWSNLSQGRASITTVPALRWDHRELYSPEPRPGRSTSKWGGFIDGIELLDPAAFGIPEADAAHVDPLIRLMLECGTQAVRDAGLKREDLWGRDVGVYVGAGTSSYGERIPVPHKGTVTGLNQNFIGAHLAHVNGWHGPNLVLDSACSSSLVAVHLACQALATGDCELALAGGADILLDERPYLRLSAGKALSPDGRCFTFDRRANGFVPGEGCGAVLLKPLEQAIGDGDRIYGVIEGSAVNNDGHTMGLTTPSVEAQERVIAAAYERHGIDAATISLIEAHGTGTMIGDPIELRALTNVLRRVTDECSFCGVGSVKTNIGHLLLASGIASFIKVALALHHRLIPPTLNCSDPNPRFELATSPFELVLEARPWEPRCGLRRAGISSFGFGGTNCHAVLRDIDSLVAGPWQPCREPLPPPEMHRQRYWVERPTATPQAEPSVAEPELLAPMLVLEEI